MKSRFAAFFVALLLFQALPALGKVRCTPVYIFGVSASFNDSIVYFTDIQIIDSAWVDEHDVLLVGRPDYSYQLRDYLLGRGATNRTCLVSFALKEKDILKKYQKMKKKFNGTKKHPKKFDFREIEDDEFKFEAVKPDASLISDSSVDEKAARRAEKSKEKKSKGKLKDSGQSAPSVSSDTPPTMPPRQ